MRAIIEIFLAIIFSVSLGNLALEMKKKAIFKIYKGLDPISTYTQKLTK